MSTTRIVRVRTPYRSDKDILEHYHSTVSGSERLTALKSSLPFSKLFTMPLVHAKNRPSKFFNRSFHPIRSFLIKLPQ